VLRTVCSLMRPAEATGHIRVADEEGIADSAKGTLDRAKSLTRPAVETKIVVGTAASVVNATDGGGAAGVC
jgi:hypothetical protein